jgi:hypothetical protein
MLKHRGATELRNGRQGFFFLLDTWTGHPALKIQSWSLTPHLTTTWGLASQFTCSGEIKGRFLLLGTWTTTAYSFICRDHGVHDDVGTPQICKFLY